MQFGTVTSKGQITIPQKIRKQLGLKAGSKLSFIQAENGEVRLQRVLSADEAFGCLAKYNARKRPASLEEMDQGIAKAVAERARRASR